MRQFKHGYEIKGVSEALIPDSFGNGLDAGIIKNEEAEAPTHESDYGGPIARVEYSDKATEGRAHKGQSSW